jgi:hypothetical protein
LYTNLGKYDSSSVNKKNDDKKTKFFNLNEFFNIGKSNKNSQQPSKNLYDYSSPVRQSVNQQILLQDSINKSYISHLSEDVKIKFSSFFSKYPSFSLDLFVLFFKDFFEDFFSCYYSGNIEKLSQFINQDLLNSLKISSSKYNKPIVALFKGDEKIELNPDKLIETSKNNDYNILYKIVDVKITDFYYEKSDVSISINVNFLSIKFSEDQDKKLINGSKSLPVSSSSSFVFSKQLVNKDQKEEVKTQWFLTKVA